MPLGASGGKPYGFTGEHWDAATGLIYLRACWYDPATGRFLTRDPFPGLALLPQTQRPYVYVANNPVNLTDPSGELAFVPLLLVGIAGGFLGGVGAFTLQAYLRADPCAGMAWQWQEALFWGGVGAGMGALLGVGIYGGWWVWTTFGPAATTAGPTIIWLEQQIDRVQHIMRPEHAWDRLVSLSGDLLQSYRAVQPYIRQAITTGIGRQIGVSRLGPVMEYVATIDGQQVVVRAIRLANGAIQITDAWVRTR